MYTEHQNLINKIWIIRLKIDKQYDYTRELYKSISLLLKYTISLVAKELLVNNHNITPRIPIAKLEINSLKLMIKNIYHGNYC